MLGWICAVGFPGQKVGDSENVQVKLWSSKMKNDSKWFKIFRRSEIDSIEQEGSFESSNDLSLCWSDQPAQPAQSLSISIPLFCGDNVHCELRVLQVQYSLRALRTAAEPLPACVTNNSSTPSSLVSNSETETHYLLWFFGKFFLHWSWWRGMWQGKHLEKIWQAPLPFSILSKVFIGYQFLHLMIRSSIYCHILFY